VCGQDKEVVSLKGRHAEMSKELILKLHSAENEVLSLSRQLEDAQVCRFPAERVTGREAGRQGGRDRDSRCSE
jgi:hypothetical protein